MSDAYTPITTSRSLQTPQGHRIYTTTRDVATEFPIPVVGSLLAASNFIAGFTGHYVLDVNDYPNRKGGKTVVVTHGSVPSGTFTEYESLAYTFPAIYPTSGLGFFEGGSRQRQRVVPARVTYEYALDPGPSGANWLASPTIWDFVTPTTGPFEVASGLQESAGVYYEGDEDESGGRVGDYLNPTFITQDTVNNPITISIPGILYYEIPASVPSATTYASWFTAKTELMVSRTIHTWYSMYMRRTVYVRAQ